MTNIAEEVRKFMNRQLYLQQSFQMGIINYRALAKIIISTQKINGTIDSVISALRRYESKENKELYKKAVKIFEKTITISTRSKLVRILIIKEDKIQQILPQIFSIVNYAQGDVLRITQADKSLCLIFDQKNFENILKLIPKKFIKAVDKNLAEINLYLHPDTKHTPGITAILSNDLAMNHINIIGTISCNPEWIWIVEEKDLIKTYNVFYQLWQNSKIHNNEDN